VAEIDFGFVVVEEGAIAEWLRSASAHALALCSGRRQASDLWLTAVPAIIVTPEG
jgi:hypothetical protein